MFRDFNGWVGLQRDGYDKVLGETFITCRSSQLILIIRYSIIAKTCSVSIMLKVEMFLVNIVPEAEGACAGEIAHAALCSEGVHAGVMHVKDFPSVLFGSRLNNGPMAATHTPRGRPSTARRLHQKAKLRVPSAADVRAGHLISL
ncbi:hypothetical protein EVAR_15020_1 [Eumeta japonica]|uniref:Uncharacterized protein n=1 Tax=Eumeta variegata TaxID=151549 RepID=A0A4C1X5J2_EUMVA|nr:hypothetical protein EVAR_15020_1 [Eumeta japonica]